MKARLPLRGQLGSVIVDTKATNGAVVGVNLRWADGRLVTATDFAARAVEPAGHTITDQVFEGATNRYFTRQRARDAVGFMPPVNFAFGDASPAVVATLQATSEITHVSLQIEGAFNGSGAQIKLGTAAAPGLLLDSWQNDPATAGVYEASPRVELPSGTTLILTITPGAGASLGVGQFVITAVPST